MTVMQKVQATTMERRLAAEALLNALKSVETGKEPAGRVETVKRLHRKKAHYVPAPPALATSLARAK